VNVSLNPADAVELADFLRFLDEWLTRDREQLGDSLARLMGSHTYGIDILRHDLARFSALLGPGNDDGAFWTAGARQPP
jgi:hypothetical protein